MQQQSSHSALFLVGNKEDEEIIYPRISRRGLLDGVLVQAGQKDDKLTEELIKSSSLSDHWTSFHIGGVNYIDGITSGAMKATDHLHPTG